jgi:nicotinamide-nucleotide amidase
MDRVLYELSQHVGEALKARGWLLATAESCTGGWVGEAVTAVSGSSAWYDRGFITYSNEAKQDMLGVNPGTLDRFGAVSEETVREMVAGTLSRSRAQVALALSGVAGPAGGTSQKPVGMVCFGLGQRDGVIRSETWQLAGDREAVRRQAVEKALLGVLRLLAV